MGLEEELIEDLIAELSIVDPMFESYSVIIQIKVKSAVREVKKARKYPSSYSEKMIEDDLQNYYSKIREIALYDYNMIGMEYQSSRSESGVSQSMVDRNSLFGGIIPISQVV